MKRTLFIIALLFTVLLCRTPTQAALDYSLTDYLTNKAYIGAGNYNDPLFQLWTELDASLISGSGASTLILVPGSAPSSPTEGWLYANDTGNNLQYYNGTAWVDIDVSGASSLDTAYGVGAGITVDAGSVTLTATDAANNDALTIIQSDTAGTSALVITNAGTGASIEIDGAGTGDDITGTGDLWTISEAGVASLAGIILGGTDMVMENAETFNNVDDDVIEFSSNDKEDFEIDLSGTNIIKFTSDSSAVTLELDALDDVNGVGNIYFDSAASQITLAANAAADDLTIQVSGAHDASLILQSAGTGTDALSLISSAADISLVSADNITRTAADDITDVTTDGAYTLTIGGSTNGKYVSTVADTYSMVAVDAVTIQNTEAGKDITVNSVLGSIVIEAEEDAANAVLITADGGVSSTLRLHNDTGTGATSIDLLSDVGGITATASAGPVVLTATGATAGDMTLTVADAFTLTSTDTAQNGIHIEANGGTAESINLYSNQGTGSSATTEHDASIQLQSDAGGISLYSTGNVADTIRLETNGGSSETIVLQNVQGTGTSSILATSTLGGIKIAANAAGKDVDIDSVLGSILIEAEEDSATAISIIADGGSASGVWIQSETGESVTEDTASVEIRSTVGGINIQSDANLDDAIMIRVDGGTTSEMTIHNDTGSTADSIELVSDAGGITLNGAVGGVVFTAGQTRTVKPTVVLDGTVPPSQTAIGTSGQSQIPVYSFDANPNATGDDYVFLYWRVPAGYVVDSADLFFTFSYSTAETDGDDVAFDCTVLAITPGSGAAGGTAYDAAGSAVAALDVDLVNGDGDEGKVMEGTFDIEVTAIAVGDEVLIAFWVDEDQCDLAVSGTIDIHEWTITYESTE